MRNVLICMLAASLLGSCTKQKEKIPPPMIVEGPSGKVIIYQLFPRLFGNKNTTNKPYGTKDENGVGKFNDISDAALSEIRRMGVSHVWYTGVIEHALLTDYSASGIPPDDADVVKGRAGSPYAIKDYYDVDPDLATNVGDRMKEFEQLISRTKSKGLKVIIDFVPNHVARAYKSDAKPSGTKDLGETDDKARAFDQQNNFYYLPGQSFRPPKATAQWAAAIPMIDGQFEEVPAKVTGNDEFTASPGVDDWYETVKLNYGVDIQNGRKTNFDPVPDTWNKMKDILLFWVSKNVDGFRCDMAEMVPVEFWGWVIPQIKSVNPQIVFIAEIYNPGQYRTYLEKGKFNYLYDKVQLYDTLRLLIKGQRSTADIGEIRNSLADINDKMLHFLENHDEQRIASDFFAGDPWKAFPAMVISATVDRGPVMIYFGQHVGEPGSGAEGFNGDDGRTTIYDYWGVPQHQRWMGSGDFAGTALSAEQKQLHQSYTDLLNLAAANVAMTNGEYLDLTNYNIGAGNFDRTVCAFLRYSGEERLLILTSFNAVSKNIKVQIPAEAVAKLSLDPTGVYIARDLLWREAEVGLAKDFSFELTCKPYSSYIFKIK